MLGSANRSSRSISSTIDPCAAGSTRRSATVTISVSEARSAALHLLQRAKPAGAEDQARAPDPAAKPPAVSHPGSLPRPRPAVRPRARSAPTRFWARPRRRPRPRSRAARRQRRGARPPRRPWPPSGSRTRLAVELDRHRVATSAGRPASSAAIRSAVSGASRIPLRKWPVASSSPSIAPATDQRQVVGGRRPQAGDRLDQLELGDLGEHPVRLAQQLVHAPGGDPGVEALLLDGRADDQPAVAARDDVDALGDHDPLAHRLGRAAGEGEDLALDRPDRRPRRRRQPVGRRPGSRGDHHRSVPPSSSPLGGPHAGDPVALDDQLARLADRDPDAGRLAGARRAPRSARAGRPRPRAERARRPRRPALMPGSSSRHSRGRSHSAASSSDCISSKRRRSSAASSRSSATWSAPRPEIADVAARRRRELGGEARPQLMRAQRQLEQPLLAPASPRRPARASRRRRWRRRRPGASRSSTTTSRPCSAARQAHARPITPPPTITASSCLVVVIATGSDSSPGRRTSHRPCAGITRIRFRRSAARCRPLSPRVGLPFSFRYSRSAAAKHNSPMSLDPSTSPGRRTPVLRLRGPAQRARIPRRCSRPRWPAAST